MSTSIEEPCSKISIKERCALLESRNTKAAVKITAETGMSLQQRRALLESNSGNNAKIVASKPATIVMTLADRRALLKANNATIPCTIPCPTTVISPKLDSNQYSQNIYGEIENDEIEVISDWDPEKDKRLLSMLQSMTSGNAPKINISTPVIPPSFQVMERPTIPSGKRRAKRPSNSFKAKSISALVMKTKHCRSNFLAAKSHADKAAHLVVELEQKLADLTKIVMEKEIEYQQKVELVKIAFARKAMCSLLRD